MKRLLIVEDKESLSLMLKETVHAEGFEADIAADGKQAMLVDGKLIGEFTGIRWRNDMDLKVNCFWLEHYGYDEGDPTKQYWKDSQSVWFDDVVVARRYIGPMKR